MSSKKVIAIVIVIGIVLIALGILPPGISVFTSVPSGTTGILTAYGKVEETHLEPGIHIKAPWKRIVLMDNRVQTMRIASGTKNATVSDTAETKDQQLIPTFAFEVQYKLNTEKSYWVYENYGEDYENQIIKSNALQVIKNTFVQFKADEIAENKARIPEMVCDTLNERTAPYGVDIVRVNFETYDFSPEYTAILEERALLAAQLENNKLEQTNQTIAAQTVYDVAVKEAQKQAETQRIASENANMIAKMEAQNANDIALANAQAKAEADKIAADNDAYVVRTAAEAERDARIAAAEAEKAELEARSDGLTAHVLTQDWIQKWDGKLIPSFGTGTGDIGFGFTNYTGIIEKYLFPDQQTDGKAVNEND